MAVGAVSCGLIQKLAGGVYWARTLPRTITLTNLFSPNGDQMNDRFVIYASKLKSLQWRIYNRHGRLVYETSSVEEATQSGWDGTLQGVEQPEDSYVWILIYEEDSATQGSTKLTGSVTLIR